jgi:uncharacterized cupredoxin-like copper-binding protein
MRRVLIAAACATALVSAGCSKGGGIGDAVRIVTTDDSCSPQHTSYTSGKTHFYVINKGAKVTEVYVYGNGDAIIGEVENIGPGTSRRLTVDLRAGSYEIACKPGMTGRGIRVPITVTGGKAQSAPAVASRTVEVHAVDYLFRFDDPHVTTGEAIRFELVNDGTQPHEFEVIGPNGSTVGEVEPTEPGTRDDAVIEFAEPGTYRYECHVADHHERGMHGELRVG